MESVIYGIDDFTIDSSAVTYYLQKFSAITDNLTVKIGGTTVATRSNVSSTDTGTLTKTITFSASERTAIYNAMPKTTRATFTFIITSFAGSQQVSTSSATATGTLPASMKPTLTSINLSEGTTGIATKFQGYVKNKSKLNYSYTTSLATGSSMSSYFFTIDGVSYTGASGATNIIQNSGTINYTAYVIDSRGRKSDDKTGSITVIDYSNPIITTFEVIRCDAGGLEDVEGLYAKYTVNASISPANNKNDKTIKIEYKKQNSDTWTNWKTSNTYTLNETSQVLAIEDVPYNFRLTVTDYFSSPTKTYDISGSYLLFELTEDLDGIAWGKRATESNTFDIGFQRTNLSKTTYVGGQEDTSEKNMWFPNPTDSTYPHSSKLYGGNSTSPVAIGMWDSDKNLPIYQYFDGSDYRLKFGDDIALRWGNYDIEAVLQKASSNTVGRYYTKEGFLIQWGTVSITGGSGTPTNVSVTFPIAYDVIPLIVESPVSTVIGTTVLGTAHGSDSATGTTLYCNRTNTANTSVRWLAIGYKERGD